MDIYVYIKVVFFARLPSIILNLLTFLDVWFIRGKEEIIWYRVPVMSGYFFVLVCQTFFLICKLKTQCTRKPFGPEQYRTAGSLKSVVCLGEMGIAFK